MDFIGGIISSISGYMYSYILIALLIAAGLYFSFRTDSYRYVCWENL